MRADKLREVREGHDGTWVAHPGLVAVAKGAFDEGMPSPNQLGRLDGGRFDEARGTFERVATSDELAEFLTLPAYDLLVAGEVRGDRMRQET